MPTAFQFSSTQLTEIARLRKALTDIPNNSTPGGGAALYSYIFKCATGIDLTGTDLNTPADNVLAAAINTSMPQDQHLALIWLYGALQVNKDVGAFSQVIREYNIRQGELRGMGTFIKEKLDEASNAVAVLFADSILNPTSTSYQHLPLLQEIGNADLNGVRNTLYPGNENPGAELYLNQAWPGIVMLGSLGGQYTDRLLRYNDANQPIALNSLADFKAMLFAWDSFKTAWDKTSLLSLGIISDALIALNWPASFVATAVSEYNSNGASSLPQFVFSMLAASQNAEAKKGLDAIAKLGSNKFLDMLMGATVGKSQIGTTTDANFESRATTFFNAYGNTLQAIGAHLLPSDAAGLVTKAQANTAEGANARAALAALSVVSVEASAPIAAQFSLYNAVTGQGNITQSWIIDRAAMVDYFVRISQSGSNAPLSVPGAQGMHFKDFQSGIEIDIGLPDNVVEKRQTLFGGDANETITGKKLADHLYGGGGADALLGLGGDDYLQGDAGADTLNGGDGIDTLMGGAGADTYVLSGDWGIDTIIDSDGLGSIQVDGVSLNGGNRLSANAWQSADEQWRYALTERDELIITSANKPGRILVKDWSRMLQTNSAPLGLSLPQASVPQQPEEPGMYALQGGYFVPGGAQLPGGTWQIQSDGSIPGAVPLQNSNDLMVGGQDALGAPGTFQRISGVALDAQGNQYFTYANTRAVSLWGLGGNDFMSGEQYDDYLDGGEGNDLIFGGAGSDTIYGGGGDDIIVSNMAAVHINDAVPSSPPPGYVAGPTTVITYFGSEANFQGRWWVEKSEDGSNIRIPRAYIKNPDAGYTYYAESQNDLDFVDAGDGDDYVWGGRGADYLIGGAGADHLTGLGGDDLILGGLGKDVIYGDDWAGMRLAAVYDQDPGNYYLANMPFDAALKNPALHGDDVIDAGAGDDEVWGDGGDDVIFGGSGSDQLMGDALQADLPGEFHGSDTLDGGDGNDYLYGFGGDDALFGGSGDDELYGDYEDLNAQFHGNDELYAGDGADLLWGNGGDDLLDASEDDGAIDQLVGGEGDDYLMGGSGNDTLFGDAGNDALLAGAFNTYMEGGAGNDHYVTNAGSDTMFDDAGDDVYALSGGGDYIEDAGGSDIYQIDSAMLASLGTTVIKDADGVGSILYDGIVLNSSNVNATAVDVWRGAGGLAKLQKSSSDLVISSGSSGATGWVVLKNFFSQASAFNLQLPNYVPPNSAPVVGTTLTPPKLTIGTVFSYAVGSDAFVDADQGDVLTLTATRVNGNQLPDWLSFNATTRTFTGTPPAGSAQNIDVTLTATDNAGASVAQTLVFVIKEPAVPAGQNITGTSGDDVLVGAAGNDVIVGLSGNDTLDGGDGNDTLDGGVGNDILKGWHGNNTYLFGKGDGNDSIDITRGGAPRLNDFNILQFKDGVRPDEIIVTREVDDLVLSIAGFSDSITVKNLFYGVERAWVDISLINEFRFSDGASWDLPTVRLMEAANHSTDGYDRLYGSWTDDVLNGGLGDDDIYAAGGDDLIAGGGGDDHLYGSTGNDILLGQAGRDLLYGEDGNDAMYGGEGNDRLRDVQGKNIFDGGAGDDILDGGGRDKDIFMFGKGDGSDTVVFGAVRLSEVQFKNGVTPDEITVTRTRSDLILSISGTSDKITLQYFFSDLDPSNYVSPVQQVKFADGTIWDLAALNSKAGTYINKAPVFGEIEPLDLLNGVGLVFRILDHVSDDDGDLQYSAELENGSALPSWLILDEGYLTGTVSVGASGNEVIHVRITVTDKEGLSSSGIVVLNLSSPGVTLYGTANADVLNGAEYTDRLYGGGGNDQLFGKAGADKLYGEDGNDVLNGGIGDDELYGGSGNDTYVVDAAGDLVIELANEGTDLVQSAVTYTLAANVENLTLTGTAAINCTGNTGDNTLIGNSGVNTLTGEAGNDVLNGGAGADTMLGGAGDDTYVVDAAGDVVTELANEGTDLVQSGVTYTLAANVENLTLTGTAAINGTGNSGDNTLIGNSGINILTGNAGNDVLDGKAGADTMQGGAGDDTYYVDNASDVVTELASEGTDLVQSAVTYTLATNVDNLTLTGTTAINGTGNTGDNVLIGNSGVNTLTGNAGNDVLDGKAGADTMKGGAGNDIYYVDNVSDVVTELASEGADTVNSAVTLTLAANVENLILTGTAALNATGNTLANTLTGNSGNNTLSGGAGSDTMVGGAGNDTYVVDATGDVVTELTSEGTDLVQSSVTYTLAANVENLTLTGTAAINGTGNSDNNTLTGNSGVNTLTGNAGNDVLDALAGADTMKGGIGNDTYYVDNASDVVTELASEGTDTVMSTISYTLGTNVENLRINATGALNATGNTADNILYAGAGNNVLNGLGGTDTASFLYASAAVTVSLASASAQSTGGSGSDTLTNMENLEGSNYNDTLTGNTAANVLQGGLGNDTLNGAAGNDTLNGGAGTDTLVGGTGNDTYLLGRGYGSDSITENDATAGNVDMALFGADIAIDQIWLRQVGNNLEVSVIGGSDKFTLNSWYLGSQYHVEQFKTSDGHMLTDANVQNLVQAMASFSPPAAGQTTLPSNYQTSLATVIAANWQ